MRKMVGAQGIEPWTSPVFMDFRTDPTENVFPMVQAGKGITEMLLGAEDL